MAMKKSPAMEACDLREVPFSPGACNTGTACGKVYMGLCPIPRIGFDVIEFFCDSVLWLRWPQRAGLNFSFY